MKFNKKKFIIGVVIGSLIISGSILYVNSVYSSKVKQADALTAKGDYAKAITIYGQAMNIYKGSDIKGKLSNAESLLSKQEAMIKNSTKAFENGISAFNNKDYLGAIACFKGVIKEDVKDYDSALKKSEECKTLYTEKVIDEANLFATKHEYNNAINCLDNFLSIYPNNKQITDLRGKYTVDNDNYLKAIANQEAQTQKSSTASAVKITTAPKPSSKQTQVQRTPNILGTTDPQASFSYLKFFGFNIETPRTDTVSINNFRISWDGDGSPNFVLRLIDWTNNPYEEVIFWAYIGNVHSYTIPASLLKVGHGYRVEVTATNGTNYQKPGYETLSPKNVSAIGFNVNVTN